MNFKFKQQQETFFKQANWNITYIQQKNFRNFTTINPWPRSLLVAMGTLTPFHQKKVSFPE